MTGQEPGRPQKIAYFAIVDEYSSRSQPAGVLRRAETDDGTRDEAFGRNLEWGHRCEMPQGKLHEITEDEAGRIVDRMLRDAAREP